MVLGISTRAPNYTQLQGFNVANDVIAINAAAVVNPGVPGLPDGPPAITIEETNGTGDVQSAGSVQLLYRHGSGESERQLHRLD